jgi:hypothetical protein
MEIKTMLMKWLTNWQVSLVAAVLLTNSLVSPGMAQTGNQSDATGPILSTSDFAGQTFPSPSSGRNFRGENRLKSLLIRRRLL